MADVPTGETSGAFSFRARKLSGQNPLQEMLGALFREGLNPNNGFSQTKNGLSVRKELGLAMNVAAIRHYCV